MHFRRQKTSDEGVNLTPLIDVVFLLLIFFMVSTTFINENHLTLELPEADGELRPDTAERIEVTINADGTYGVNGESLVNSRLSTLMAAIDEQGQGNTKLPFIVTADAKVPYEAVVTVMDAAGRMGYSNLSMTTQQPAESE